MTRRSFLGKGATLIAAGWAVPAFIAETARILESGPALATPASAAASNRILVMVQLAGGNDGLNTLIPYTDQNYYAARRLPGIDISVPANQVLQLNGSVGLTPQWSNLKSRWDRGQMAIVQGVSYPNPNRSHFRGMDIWESAAPDRLEPTGWLGRYIQSCGCVDPNNPNKLGALALGTAQEPYTFWNEMTVVPAVASLSRFRYIGVDPSDTPTPQRTAEVNTLLQALAISDGTPEGENLRASMKVALNDSAVIQAAAKDQPTVGNYPNDSDVFKNSFGESFRLIAQSIKANLGAQIFYIGLSGFDTHGLRGPGGETQQTLLQRANQAIDAFLSDMEAIGRLQDVLLVTFSEFGRRVAVNGSGGTDHGVAAPMFLFGGDLNQGLYGTHPSLTDLDAGDLKMQVDFRQVYATILQDWLGIAPSPILGGTYQTLPFIKDAASPTPPVTPTPPVPPTPAPSCSPRAPVKVSTTASGGKLQVTLQAGVGAIREIRFGPAQNALVDVGSLTGQTGNFTYRPASPTGQVSLSVRRTAAGTTHVPFTVADDCGDWPTFVGGGPNAF